MVRELCSADMKLSDQGKQPKIVHVPERSGPLEFSLLVQVIRLGNKGAMEMRNGDDVPGIAGQGACKEASRVVDEMNDDHFEDLHR